MKSKWKWQELYTANPMLEDIVYNKCPSAIPSISLNHTIPSISLNHTISDIVIYLDNIFEIIHGANGI